MMGCVGLLGNALGRVVVSGEPYTTALRTNQDEFGCQRDEARDTRNNSESERKSRVLA